MLINVKMPTLVGIFNIYQHGKYDILEGLKARKIFIFQPKSSYGQ